MSRLYEYIVNLEGTWSRIGEDFLGLDAQTEPDCEEELDWIHYALPRMEEQMCDALGMWAQEADEASKNPILHHNKPLQVELSAEVTGGVWGQKSEGKIRGSGFRFYPMSTERVQVQLDSLRELDGEGRLAYWTRLREHEAYHWIRVSGTFRCQLTGVWAPSSVVAVKKSKELLEDTLRQNVCRGPVLKYE
jgi:hypothetical protein